MLYVDEMTKDEYKKLSQIDYKIEKKLNVKKFKNAYVLPAYKYCNKNHTLFGSGGVVSSNGLYVEDSAMKAHNMSNRLYGQYKFNEKKVKYVNEKVIYLNFFIHQWGHYLVDVIGRLWYILNNDNSDYKIVYTCQKGKNDKIQGNYLELLNLLGIDESRLIMVNEVTKFNEVIIPESSIYPGKYYTMQYKQIFDKIIENSKIKNDNINKIYCSRQKFKKANKKEIGESKIEKIFNDNGYKSICFENLSVQKQIQLINSSKEMVAISGTLPHNLLFARNGVHMVILNKTYKINLHQFMINQLSESQVDFVDVGVSPLPVLYGNGPFIIKITSQVKKYFENKNLKLTENVCTRLTLKDKLWYYFKYLVLNRGKIIKDDKFSRKDIRNAYKQIIR